MSTSQEHRHVSKYQECQEIRQELCQKDELWCTAHTGSAVTVCVCEGVPGAMHGVRIILEG